MNSLEHVKRYYENCINRVCPSRSCLQPLSWNIVTDSAFVSFENEENIKIQPYADHFLLAVKDRSKTEYETRVQFAVNLLTSWVKDHKHTLSALKTQACSFFRVINLPYFVIPFQNVQATNSFWILESSLKYPPRHRPCRSLDPAGPFFNRVVKAVRLDKGDASFVDVIHTNWAGHRLSGYGLETAIGHVDFYPNGGEDQPGCETALEATLGVVGEVLSYMNIWSLVYKYVVTGTLAPQVDKNVKDMTCSHGRAYEYFIASLEELECEFQSLACNSWDAYVMVTVVRVKPLSASTWDIMLIGLGTDLDRKDL
ncbi:Lipase member I, partial [Stegodyphus mimosarum]